MSRRHILGRLARDVEGALDRLKYRVAYRCGGPDPLCIVPYRGFGTRERVVVRGRVLEDQGLGRPRDDDSRWRNLRNTWRRFETDEVPHARVRVRLRGEEHDTVADEEGHFDLTIDTGRAVARRRLLARGRARGARAPLAASGGGRAGDGRDPGAVVPGRLRGHQRHRRHGGPDGHCPPADGWCAALLLGNARTRAPFAGAAAFYRELHAGVNPLFYVSNGPVNLHDLLEDFLDQQGFPPRPVIFLRNWGIDEFGFLPDRPSPATSST